jgi:hypothetical protein
VLNESGDNLPILSDGFGGHAVISDLRVGEDTVSAAASCSLSALIYNPNGQTIPRNLGRHREAYWTRSYDQHIRLHIEFFSLCDLRV